MAARRSQEEIPNADSCRCQGLCGRSSRIGRFKELAETIRDIVNPQATLVFDESRPDGTPRKLLDITRLRDTGWKPRIALHDGLHGTYQWFLENIETARGLS